MLKFNKLLFSIACVLMLNLGASVDVLALETKISTSTSITDTKLIKDDNLFKLLQEKLNKNNITKEDLKEITSLDLSNSDIKDLSGLELCENLEILYLNDNEINDISLLGKMKNLRDLDLNDNDIEDISPLANLKNLKYLNLNNNKIKDVTSLANLNGLKKLNIRNNQIEDITSLFGLDKTLIDARRQMFTSDIIAYSNVVKVTTDKQPYIITHDGKYISSTNEIIWTNVKDGSKLEYEITTKLNNNIRYGARIIQNVSLNK